MKIYIVQAYGGEYEDSWTSNVKAFKTKEKAEEYVHECKDNVPEYSEYFSKLMWRIHRVAHACALKAVEEGYNEEYGRVDDILREKARKKYPQYTDDRDEANVWYKIDEVEYEE